MNLGWDCNNIILTKNKNMSKNKQIWVSPNPKGWWKVHKPGGKKSIANTETKEEAKKIAEDIARNQKLETKIQKKDGTIQWWNSYGNDPHPPKDKNG